MASADAADAIASLKRDMFGTLRGAVAASVRIIAIALQVAAWAVSLVLLLYGWLLLRAPALGDRIVALDTMMINVIALIVLVGMIGGNDTTYLEAALLLAIVGFVSAIAYCEFVLRGDIVE